MDCVEAKRADSVNDLSGTTDERSRNSVAGTAGWNSMDEKKGNLSSPPGSPPPPYGKRSSDRENQFGVDHHKVCT